MSDTVKSALIAVAGSIIVQIIILIAQRSKEKTEREVRQAKLDAKLQIIDDKLEEHNNYASRLSEIGTCIALIKQDIEYLKNGLFNKEGEG